jgi:hypothetical protein
MACAIPRVGAVLVEETLLPLVIGVHAARTRWAPVAVNSDDWSDATSLLLLVPERFHRINSASSPRRNPAGQRRDAQQNRGYTKENREVDRAIRHYVKGNHERE